MKHSRNQVVLHSVLYILFLFQTVSTICSITVNATSRVMMHFVSGSFIFTLMAGEFMFSVMQIVLLSVWVILRFSALIFGMLGFWRQTSRKIALIILTVATVLEVLASILYSIVSVIPLILTVIMLILCIKGIRDLKKEDDKMCPTDRTAPSLREINARVESLCDEPNPDL